MRVENTVDAIIFLIILVALGALLSLLLLIEQAGIATCSRSIESCDSGLLEFTTWIVPTVAAAFVVLSIVAMVIDRRTPRRSRWVPILGITATIVCFLIASLLVLVRVAVQGAAP